MLATAAIVGGFYAIYSNKVIANKAHFTTSHAKLSLVVLVASLLVQIGGAFSFFGLPKALKKHTALVNKAHKMVRETHNTMRKTHEMVRKTHNSMRKTHEMVRKMHEMMKKTHEMVRIKARGNAQSECPRDHIVENKIKIRRII